MQVSEQDLNDLRAQMNSLRAAASRGSVSSAQVFKLTDPVMDMITRGSISAAQAVGALLQHPRDSSPTIAFDKAVAKLEADTLAIGGYMPAIATRLRLYADELADRYPDDANGGRVKESSQ